MPGAIYGGVSGTMKRELQEFRDELTEELAEAESHQLTNSGLALDVHRNLYPLPGVKAKLLDASVEIPEDVDAIVSVAFSDFTIFVEDGDAVLTLSARVEVRRRTDDSVVYKRMIQYLDRDSLKNWTRDERALWNDYANFAAHFLARELAAETYGRVVVPHELLPEESDSVRRDRKFKHRFNSKSWTPELKWSLALLEDEGKQTLLDRLATANVLYDLEIYDNHRIVYSRTRLAQTSHVVDAELEPCTVYRWSVRPSYHLGGSIDHGDWLRLPPEGEEQPQSRNNLVGRHASTAPAYTQDFAQLKTKCGRR